MNSGAERRGAIRNRVRAESGTREVSNCVPTQLPRGYGCYCADQNAVAFPGGTRLDALAFAGGVLPDATLRGMRMSRSHGGTVRIVSDPNLSSEASAPGSDTPCRERRAGRGGDTSAIPIFASSPLPRGRRQLLAGRWPRVTGLTSYLSGCFRSCSEVTCFFTPPH